MTEAKIASGDEPKGPGIYYSRAVAMHEGEEFDKFLDLMCKVYDELEIQTPYYVYLAERPAPDAYLVKMETHWRLFLPDIGKMSDLPQALLRIFFTTLFINDCAVTKEVLYKSGIPDGSTVEFENLKRLAKGIGKGLGLRPPKGWSITIDGATTPLNCVITEDEGYQVAMNVADEMLRICLPEKDTSWTAYMTIDDALVGVWKGYSIHDYKCLYLGDALEEVMIGSVTMRYKEEMKRRGLI